MHFHHRARLFAVLACALLGVGCGGGCSGGSTKDLPAAGTGTPSVAVAPSGSEPALPPLGEVKAWRDGEGLASVLASGAPRGAIVTAIAEAADFGVMIGAEADLDAPLTVRVQRETLEVALGRVLAGVPHALEYARDAGSGAKRLALVTVGRQAPAVGLAAGVTGPKPPVTGEKRRERTPEQEQKRAERAQRVWAESLENLGSYDSELRADGARWLDVSTTEGLQAAVEHLENDESPEVRVAAAGVLLDSDVGAVQPLLRALGDPDPRVVLAALEALEFVGDEATVPRLQPLLEHKDVEIRERTVEAIEFLQ
jgi:hypothetical protein